jgi:hypothetical protein
MVGAIHPMRRPVFQYACLLAVLAVTLVYQVRALKYQLPHLFPRASQILSLSAERNGLEVSSTYTAAVRRAGVRDGDILVALNGKPLTGIGMFGQTVARAHPGEKLLLTIRTLAVHRLESERSMFSFPLSCRYFA